MMRYGFGLTGGFRGRIAVSVCAGVLRVVAGLIFVALCKRAVDLATGNVSGDLVECVVWLVGVLVGELLCSAVGSRTAELSEAEMKDTLQMRLFGRLLRAEWTGKERFHSGDSLSRLTEDCRVVSECLCRTVPTVVLSLLQLIGAFLFLWYFSPLLAVMLMVILPVFMFAGKAFFRRMRSLTQRIREVESRLQETMQESLHHRILLLTYRQTARTLGAVSALHRLRSGLIGRRTAVTLYSRTAVFAGFESGYLAAFLWGIKGLTTGAISFGTMTAYLQLAGLIQRPLAELARLLPGLVQAHTAFSRLAEVEGIRTESAVESALQGGEGRPVGLAFEDVTFSYPEGKGVFDHFSHTFRPGSRTAVMGGTGVGKSTLLLLALAVVRPREGRISVFTGSGEGLESEAVSCATRGLFVYVPQGNSLLSGTIRENLKLGKPDVTEEEMREALHCAAADFVFDLGDGLDTVCGEHGEGLSEGQAQRIAIARGLLRPGSILLLDEISASLDEETESVLMKRLAARATDHTVIMVTHRSSTLPYCDSVVTLG